VEYAIYVDTDNLTARAALTGSAIPSISPRLQSHLLLNVYFFRAVSGVNTAALLTGSPTFRVALKDIVNPDGSVLALLSAATDTGATFYEFEWQQIDTAALRTLLGDSPSVPAMLEIEWTISSVVERVSIPVSINNAWIRSADTAPDFVPWQVSITSAGYLRILNASGTVFHIGLNTGEPPT
jgi:hypothetical protein